MLNDGWTAVTRDRSLSAQFEHTVGVTETGCEIFTLSPNGADRTPNSMTAKADEVDGLHYASPPRTFAFASEGSRHRGSRRLRTSRTDPFCAIPRRDVKPLAKTLIARFGSLPRRSRLSPDDWPKSKE